MTLESALHIMKHECHSQNIRNFDEHFDKMERSIKNLYSMIDTIRSENPEKFKIR